jgi:hypothetical protein
VEIHKLTENNYRISKSIEQLYGANYWADLKVILDSFNAARPANELAKPINQ